MRLFYSPFHDFAHKALIVIHEAGIAAQIETIPTFPFRNLNAEWVTGQYDISALNPLGTVPFLTLDDGTALYASQVVVEYLDSLGDRSLYPAQGADRYDALRRLAIGDGVFEAAVRLSMEAWRDPAERREDLYDWIWPKIGRSLTTLDRDTSNWSSFDIGQAGTLQGLSYLDAWASGRDDIPGNLCKDWRATWPTLAAWFEKSLQRPSVQSHYRQPYEGDSSPERHQAAVEAVLAARGQ